MEYTSIIITGTSGAGKTTVARRICDIGKVFTIVQAVTTREPRDDDSPGEYQYISEEEFEQLAKKGELLIESKYGSAYYGITTEAFQKVIDGDKAPLLIVTPEAVGKLEAEQSQKTYEEKLSFLTIFLDATDEMLDKRLTERGQQITTSIMEQRQVDREWSKACIYNIVNINANKVIELILSLWKYRNTGGIIPARLLSLMVECGTLLENAKPENITGAAYDLRLGSEYYYGGEPGNLTDKEAFLRIEPYEYALVTSQEITRFPRDVTGRFDLAVSLFCQGIILSNGPQVDPGFKGTLWCLLFNTTNDVIHLKLGQHYATIEFHKSIEPTFAYEGKYQDMRKLMDYLPKRVSRSPISDLKKDIKALKSEKLWLRLVPIYIALGIAIAALVNALR